MSRRIGVAVIGMGWMGSVHARSHRLVPQRFPELDVDPRLVVCADNVEARAQEGVTRAGFERATTDWREAVADPEVEVVVITTQNALHKPIALAAIAAGKHVFCEKPVGRSPAETAAIAAAAREAGIISGVGYNYRWAPVVQYALGLIRDGRLGAITHFRGRFLVGYARDPHGVLSWRFDRDQSGSGAVADLMSHVADLAHMLAGPRSGWSPTGTPSSPSGPCRRRGRGRTSRSNAAVPAARSPTRTTAARWCSSPAAPRAPTRCAG